MKWYTVVGYWADTNEPWVEYAKGESPAAAVVHAAEALNEDGSLNSDLTIVSVFEGKHQDKLSEPNTFLAEDVLDEA